MRAVEPEHRKIRAVFSGFQHLKSSSFFRFRLKSSGFSRLNRKNIQRFRAIDPVTQFWLNQRTAVNRVPIPGHNGIFRFFFINWACQHFGADTIHPSTNLFNTKKISTKSAFQEKFRVKKCVYPSRH